MFRNFFKVAIRHLLKQRIHASINIIGLATGIAAVVMIFIYVRHELSYDRFHERAEDIYRMNFVATSGGNVARINLTPTALIGTLNDNIPEIETGARLYNYAIFQPMVVKADDQLFQEDKFYYADSTFFQVFSFPLISGNPDKALVDPGSILISEKIAMKYFGNSDVLGRELEVNTRNFKITGVMKDFPENSHFHADLIASFSSTSASKEEIWGSANYGTYVMLQEGANHHEVNERIRMVIDEALKDQNTGDFKVAFELFPVTDIHLRSTVEREWEPQNNVRYVYSFIAIALVILLIACINYINMATSRSTERAREVGMRKSLGASKSNLVAQFLGESLLISLSSVVFSVAIIYIALPVFNALTGKSFTPASLSDPVIWIVILLIGIVVGLLAGSYPALVISKFQPTSVLKGSFKSSKSGIWLRRILVVGQFGISVLLIIGTVIIFSQLQYMQSKKLGYNKENVIFLPTDRNMIADQERIRVEMTRLKEVTNVTFASESPALIKGGYSMSVAGMAEDDRIFLTALSADRHFVNTMNIELLSGSDFSEADVQAVAVEEREERRYSFLINEETLKLLDHDANSVLGLQVNLNGRVGTIKGVVKNFHFSSLHDPITPLAIFLNTRQFNQIFLRVEGENVQAVISTVGEKWQEVVPERPFDFKFLDQQYGALYNSETRLGEIFTVFSFLAIVIASLGLLGLISYTTLQRSKEIGIRKVMGATVSGLIVLITNDFAKLILAGLLISIPAGYLIMDSWLNDFEYRITIGIIPFILAGVITITVAVLTIGFQSVKAATANPVDALRDE